VGLNSVIHKFSSRANILRAATTYGLVKSVQFIFHSHSCEQRIQVGNLETHVAMHLGPFALLSRRFLPTSLQEFVMNHLPWCALGGLFLLLPTPSSFLCHFAQMFHTIILVLLIDFTRFRGPVGNRMGITQILVASSPS